MLVYLAVSTSRFRVFHRNPESNAAKFDKLNSVHLDLGLRGEARPGTGCERRQAPGHGLGRRPPEPARVEHRSLRTKWEIFIPKCRKKSHEGLNRSGRGMRRRASSARMVRLPWTGQVLTYPSNWPATSAPSSSAASRPWSPPNTTRTWEARRTPSRSQTASQGSPRSEVPTRRSYTDRRRPPSDPPPAERGSPSRCRSASGTQRAGRGGRWRRADLGGQ